MVFEFENLLEKLHASKHTFTGFLPCFLDNTGGDLPTRQWLLVSFLVSECTDIQGSLVATWYGFAFEGGIQLFYLLPFLVLLPV